MMSMNNDFAMNKNILLLLVLSLMTAFIVSCVPVVAGAGAITAVSVNKDRRSAGTILDDKNLATSAESVLEIDPQLADHSYINVNVYKGAVLLTGEVEKEAMLTHIETLLKTKYPNIIRIHNELKVTESASFYDVAKDVAITSAVLFNYQNQEVFNPTHVKVVTETQVVYLMGAVTKREGDMAAKLASEAIGVEQVVKLFEYLAQKPQSELDEEAAMKAKQQKQAEIDQQLATLKKQKQQLNKEIKTLEESY